MHGVVARSVGKEYDEWEEGNPEPSLLFFFSLGLVHL